MVDNVPVYIALRPEKIMLCEDPPADGFNFAVGEVVHIAYLGDLSLPRPSEERADAQRPAAKRTSLP